MSKYPPLDFAKAVSDRANAAWEDGSFMESVTPTTKELLTFWFEEAYTEMRDLNFHKGQRQAILNVIYLHEVLKVDTVLETYEAIAPQLLLERGCGLEHLSDAIYQYPKYAVKMATGTGKTWVAEALVIWQYLNAKHEDGNYTKNFLIVAPGLIVYERLLDAFLGKLDESGESRVFETCDLKKNEDLFIPESYRDEVYGFVQGSVAAKTEIGSKVTGDGIIAITNYHLLMGDKNDEGDSEIDSWSLPVSPGLTAGNSLDVLDASLNGKRELEFLRKLPNLMVINDEAHHIHENKKGGETTEVEWQKSLRYIAETKGVNNIQLDFSATPYNQKGKEKIYFPHIVVDFELETAIRDGLVKTIVLDERKELNTEELDYKAVRDDRGKVIDLSDGQRTMLRAGLSKLELLEDAFEKVDDEKSPKLLVMCEDTEVVPLVSKFLQEEGLDAEDVLEIHSNKKGEVGQEEWDELKHKLFSLDKHRKPRIVISVLMLREGFDVNNVCVIVPLRSSTSGILLEQTIGRGLRLMWRGNAEIEELKRENRHRIMVEKKEANNYFDVLSIIEHPAFRDFYKELLEKGLIGEDTPDGEGPEVHPKGDLLVSKLKEGFEEYDFRLPLIVSEAEEVMKAPEVNIQDLKPLPFKLEALQRMVPENEKWISTEITSDVHFGDFDVVNGIFRATSYNDYLMRIVSRITEKLSTPVDRVSNFRKGSFYPALSINNAQIAGIIDEYVRKRLFNQEVEPNTADVWKVLRIKEVIDHIIGQISGHIVKMQEQTSSTSDSQVRFTPLSSVEKIMIRENYCLELTKCIYEKMSYPSNKGIFERDFMEYTDNDSGVDALCKIIEQRHTFVRFRYVREDGLPAEYIPDFFVRFGDDIYIVETKAQNQITAQNVVRKQKAILRWVERINELPAEKRENKTWHYAILSDSTFYQWKNKRMNVREMLEFAELRNETVKGNGRLF